LTFSQAGPISTRLVLIETQRRLVNIGAFTAFIAAFSTETVHVSWIFCAFPHILPNRTARVKILAFLNIYHWVLDISACNRTMFGHVVLVPKTLSFLCATLQVRIEMN
jgi:hypothetical protein